MVLDQAASASVLTQRPHNRRLFRKVLIAFYKAYDDRDADIAGILLEALERLISSSDESQAAERRKSQQAFDIATKMLRTLVCAGPMTTSRARRRQSL